MTRSLFMRAAAWLLLLSLLSFDARAQSESDVEDAKRLGTEALALYDAGKYAEALAKFDQADAHARVPTLDLYAARCLVKLRRLMAAKARYQEVTRAVLPVGSSPKWEEAKKDAAAELQQLDARIPTVRIVVIGAGNRRATLTIDNHAAPLEDAHAVDPGKHAVDVVVGDAHYQREVAVREGEHPTVELHVTEPAVPTRTSSTSPEQTGPSALVIAGAVTLSFGAAGLIVWGATGGAALAKASSQGCDGAQCQGDVSGLAALRKASMISFYVGAPLTLIGGTLLTVAAVTGNTSVRTGLASIEVDVRF